MQVMLRLIIINIPQQFLVSRSECQGCMNDMCVYVGHKEYRATEDFNVNAVIVSFGRYKYFKPSAGLVMSLCCRVP